MHKKFSFSKKFGVISTLGITSSLFVNYFLESKKRSVVAQAKNQNDIVCMHESGTKHISYACSCHFNKQINNITYNKKYQHIIPKLFRILNQRKEEFGCPGLSFGIFKNGELVMKGGIGFADIENEKLCSEESIFRIASISKSLTSIAVGKLMEEGLLDIDEPIQKYINNFPVKTFNEKPVEITTRHLLTHCSGIRGYFDGDEYKESEADDKAKRKRAVEISKYGDPPTNSNENYFSKHYKNVEDGLHLFINDPLIYKPNTDYEYSSLAWSIISRIIEKCAGQDFVTYMERTCAGLQMRETVVELNEPLVSGRSRNYNRDKNHHLKNTAYIDNSYKWSGGGFLSNINDLLMFGENLLNSVGSDTGYLKSKTVHQLWEVNPVSMGIYSKKSPKLGYALGWVIKPKDEQLPYTVHHTGGAVGASSILMLVPPNHGAITAIHNGEETCRNNTTGNTFVIALIVNMQSVGLTKTAHELLHVLNSS